MVETRPEMAAIRPVAHGAVGAGELAARGLSPDAVLDFSVNTNPLGPSPAVRAALAALTDLDVARYPDPAALALRRALAARIGVDPAQIVAGNGSAELIWLLALAYARAAPERALIAGPTFGEYERACRLLGAAVGRVTATAARGFQADAAALADAVRRHRPRLVWLCNPNNPTGRYLDRREVSGVLDACRASGALLVVDEAYLPFVRHAESLVDLVASGHLFLLRSLTKDYALAGLRLGYGVGRADVADVLRAAQPPWSVSAVAQAAGLAAVADEAHLARAQAEVWAARAELVARLEEMGLAVVPPAANFVLVDVQALGGGAALRARLLEQGLVVRDCTSFGLPRHIRIGVRTRPECRRLLTAIEAVIR